MKLIHLAWLGRIGMAPLTMSVPVLGALTLGEPLMWGTLLGLMGLGLCAHLFGFALNDLIDQPLDRTLPERRNHPLATGQLSQLEAWSFTLLQVPLAFGLYGLMQGTTTGFSVLCLSVGCSIVYNLWSKQGRIPRFLPELALAASIGLLCLTGTWLTTTQIPLRSIVFALTLTQALLLVNSVPSGLKDLKTDAASGARSFVLSTGNQMLNDDHMFLSKKLWLYSAVLQTAILGCLVFLLVLFSPVWYMWGLVGALGVYGGLHLRLILTMRSFTALRRSMPLLNGYYNYAALALLVVGPMPLALQVLYGLLVIALLINPWRLSYHLWRNRYQLLK